MHRLISIDLPFIVHCATRIYREFLSSHNFVLNNNLSTPKYRPEIIYAELKKGIRQPSSCIDQKLNYLWEAELY